MPENIQQTYDTVVAYFPTQQSAEAAVRALHAAGFSRAQIGIAAQPGESSPASSGGFTVTDSRGTGSKAYEEGHKAGEAVSGFWARIRNLFENDAPEPYADEPRRGEYGTQEITDNYDYDANDFHRTLGDLPEERTRYFSSRFGRDNDGVLVTVRAGERSAEAESILERSGGDLGRDTGNYDYNQASTASDAGTRRVQLYGEVLRVHRDRIQRGEVRLRKEVVTENQTVEVPITREELVLERVPVTGEKSAPNASIGDESEIRIPLAEDRVSIEKEPVVREEVNVGKRQVTSVEARDEAVRREELRVENEADRKAS